MHEEHEREEYSREMIGGEAWSRKDAGEKKDGDALDLEAEVAKIFAEDDAEKVRTSSEDLPIPMPGKLPRKQGKREVSDLPKKEKPKQEEREVGNESKPRRRPTRRYVVALIALLMISVAVCVFAVQLGLQYASAVEEGNEEEPSTNLPTGEEKVIFVHQYDDASGLLSIPEIYAQYSDAVVSIRTKGESGVGVGSGFFVRTDGYIATVAHVIEQAQSISVITKDGRSYEASVVSANPMTDLALLKIEGEGFHALEFGASGELLVGERVIAIGTPASLDYAGTLCTGEVSYGLRTVKIYDDSGRVLQKKMKLLQTNAPVNPGNSGCPLFDEYGRVVGIVTMKLGNEYTGIGFAIPSDGAAAILASMLRGEVPSEEVLSLVSVHSPKLGILGEESAVDGIAGVRIVQFSSNTCDAAIKLHEGDLIIQVDGVAIASLEQMATLVQAKDPGEAILVTVLRAGQRLTFEVILEKS